LKTSMNTSKALPLHTSSIETNSLPLLMNLKTMSKLSRQAQSILDAYQHAPLEDEATIAEVLRTVALYCERDKIILMTLAEEFEDVKYGTYRCEIP